MTYKVKVKAVGAYLPGEPVGIEQIDLYGGAIPGIDTSRYYEVIRRFAGVEYRHYAIEPGTGKLLEDSSTLAYKAAKAALDRAAVRPDQVDLIITTTSTPPYLHAGLAKQIRVMMGNNSCATYDLWGACTGIQQAITLATGCIRAGMFRTAVLIGVELASTSGLAHNYGPKVTKEDILLRAALGDGAGAMVLAGTDDPRAEDDVIYTASGTEGDRPSAFWRLAGGSTIPLNPSVFNQSLHHWRHDFARMKNEGRSYLAQLIKRVLQSTSIDIDQVNYIIPAAANFNYFRLDDSLSGMLEQEGISVQKAQERIFTNFFRVGNIPSASIYVALDELYQTGRLMQGMRVLLASVEGATWGWGASLLCWGSY